MNIITRNYKQAGYDYTMARTPIRRDADSTSFTDFVLPDQMSLNNRATRNLEIVISQKVKLSGSTTTLDYSHNLGYMPLHFAFAKCSILGTGWWALPYFVNDGISNPQIRVTVNNNKISFLRTFTSSNVEICFYLFKREIYDQSFTG